MKVLLLGGTRDAIEIANSLLALNESGQQYIELIYSIAGIVRQPALDCHIHTGGFSQYASDALISSELSANPSQQGMKNFIQQHSIDKVVDATHPYALTISKSASAVCELLRIPLLQYIRQPWQATEKDHWIQVNTWAEAKNAMLPFKRPFVAIGRTALDEAPDIPAHQFWLIRTAIEECINQDRYQLIKAIGPFSEADERELLRSHHIDVVVCKNSGGSAVDGKLNAARQLNLPVIMLNRPEIGPHYGDRYTSKNALQKQIKH